MCCNVAAQPVLDLADASPGLKQLATEYADFHLGVMWGMAVEVHASVAVEFFWDFLRGLVVFTFHNLRHGVRGDEPVEGGFPPA